MNARVRLDALQTDRWTGYRAALRALRGLARDDAEVREVDVIYALRPFLWWLHAPGFQDLYDRCDLARDALARHPTLRHVGHPLHGLAAALSLFLSGYLDEGLHDPRGLPAPLQFGSPERAFAEIARSLAASLDDGAKDDVVALGDLAADLDDIDAHKPAAAALTRAFCAAGLDTLGSLIHDMPEDGQGHILRALEGVEGDGVAAFYEAFIARTPDDALRADARARRPRSLP
ncbi:MAG: hypothetical protein U0325_00710 [Polyangiales bacterium]